MPHADPRHRRRVPLRQPRVGSAGGPATPAGRVLTAWLAAFNAGDVADLQAFDAAYRPDAPPLSLSQRFRGDTGGFTLVRIEKSTPTLVTALLEEKDSRRLARLELEVTDDARPIVVSSTLRQACAPSMFLSCG